MRFSLLFEASPIILLHLMAALLAVVIGAIQLVSRKGTPLHQALGYLWVVAMAVICISSFGIKTIMPDGIFAGFSPIHLLSFWVLFQLARGIYYARKRDIVRHRRCMVYTYFGGLLIAGIFTLMPGRFLHKVLMASWF